MYLLQVKELADGADQTTMVIKSMVLAACSKTRRGRCCSNCWTQPIRC